ncbi:MAG: DUF2341 domain-containing protein [Pseudomonadales bacterium]|jgi:biopolymer transport protein ExbB|nr:DUF2341 domain-containing protein [Pseudomonadales bacterium]
MSPRNALLLFALIIPLTAQAWWNDAWSERRLVLLDTSEAGVATTSAVSGAVLPVRLHSGNFDFLAAKPDGSDIRLLAADDKTPLKFHIERFDSVNELALLWVQLPQIAPNSAGQKLYLYFGNPDAASEGSAPAASYDPSTRAVFHFGEGEATARDLSANGNSASGELTIEKAGLLGASARFAQVPLRISASPSLQLAPDGRFSFSGWVRLDDVNGGAVLYRQGPVAIRIEQGRLTLAGVGAQPLTGGALSAGSWQHIAVTVGGGKATLHLNGAEVAAGEAALPAVQDEVLIGEGLRGLLDELQIASDLRSVDWIRLAVGAQGVESRLLAVRGDEEVASEAGEVSYMGILVSNLTTDAWVVIVLLMVMLAIAVVVMVAKARLVSVTDKENRLFLRRFRDATDDFLDLEKQGASHAHSSLYRLYQAAVREVMKRGSEQGGINLSNASISAIKAAVDADLVRESHRLNAQMVLLTIAISGGPFLGLLGTVVGVMITFAAIAAAGDVNVNAIAPGIAAALLATVAGLAVAIPALFGYNYLASRIKNISADMQIFVDELITRIAESHSH